MPRDNSIRKVLIIGAGPIAIGQGCEFDYSGTQACKALREEGCQVVLINSNPATIMTDPEMADATYIEPLTIEAIKQIIAIEKPDALLPTMGGQTALNCTLQLAKQGILAEYSVRVIGVSLDTIECAENRERFKQCIQKAGFPVIKSFMLHNMRDLPVIQSELTFPMIIRCSYTLGGLGGGIAYNEADLYRMCSQGLALSSAGLMIEESLIGWKEFELEVVRDRCGTCLVVCGIENVDPMGVHTGDSLTVAPIQTLTDKEVQEMRRCAFSILDCVGFTVGGCNVQFAVHPRTGELRCIEINPRVSRSSALASKATGFPIAKISTKLALGYHLHELSHDAFIPFEPTLDYVAVKLPYFHFSKFPEADPQLTTSMKSVGEVLAIGRTFKEALLKAICSLEQDYIISSEKYDPWFLHQIGEIIAWEKEIQNSPRDLWGEQIRLWKQVGFSDRRLANLLGVEEDEFWRMRERLRVKPTYKSVDSCSGTLIRNRTALYSTYEEECEALPLQKKKVIVIGSGPNRIGQGIEFDYCCVHACLAIRACGYEAIMVNSNPSTVSTDPDISDKLYLSPLTVEHVYDIFHKEQAVGIIVQFGGQTPLDIGRKLQERGVPILGTSFEAIDRACRRDQLRILLQDLAIPQPENGTYASCQEAYAAARRLGYPLLIRPSHIIGGHSIGLIYSEEELDHYLMKYPPHGAPVLMEQFLLGGVEVEVDAIADGQHVHICGIVEHIDPVGIHSGDSICSLTPIRLKPLWQERLIEYTKQLGLSLSIRGAFNVQYAIVHDDIYVIEVNPRASRTLPLLSKMGGVLFVQLATRCILGDTLYHPLVENSHFDCAKAPGSNDCKMGSINSIQPILQSFDRGSFRASQNGNFQLEGGIEADLPTCVGPFDYYAVKVPVFSFHRLPGSKAVLGPQMFSTGEALGMGKTFEEAFYKVGRAHRESLQLSAAGLEQLAQIEQNPSECNVYALQNIY